MSDDEGPEKLVTCFQEANPTSPASSKVVKLKNHWADYDPEYDPEDEDVAAVISEWAHSVRPAGASKQRASRSITLEISSEEDFKRLEELIMANMNYSAKPPKLERSDQQKGKLWSIVDSGSEPTVADCAKHFPTTLFCHQRARKRGWSTKEPMAPSSRMRERFA